MARALTISTGLCLLFATACKKEEVVLRPDNQAPDYDAVPTVVVQNYVNRLFIDLLGREPVDLEMNAEVAALESADLSTDARIALVNKLMTSTAFVEGDSSYQHAYAQRTYESFKARFLEAVSDEVIDGFIANAAQAALDDSLSGDAQGASESNSALQRLLRLKNARIHYREGTINAIEMAKRMMFNAVYDEINMNSFNFINATFDNLLFRYPTDAEFNASYAMVDASSASILFGQSAQNKGGYLDILVNSAEGHEGLVRLHYRAFLGREPSTYEAYQLTSSFATDNDLRRMQRTILVGDEYAGLLNN
ncbi:MAG: hypothetical protein JNM62_01190 [Flavobacteriales bacterium]|nr:hypothetical protein [Flavobacteriales bacterium]